MSPNLVSPYLLGRFVQVIEARVVSLQLNHFRTAHLIISGFVH